MVNYDTKKKTTAKMKASHARKKGYHASIYKKKKGYGVSVTKK